MRQTLEHLEPMCDVQEMSVTTTRLTTKTAKQRARSRVQVTVEFHVVLRVVSLDLGFSRCHWCRTPQRPARWLHSSTAFHNAYATPSTKFFPSGCCSPIVSCHRQLNLYPNSCIFHIAKMCLLRCRVYTSCPLHRRQLKKICNKIGWIH